MDIRKVQKTGNMHYIYLPTMWCKKHNITSNSGLSVEEDNEGRLTLSIGGAEKKARHIKINVTDASHDIILKLIVACYINPAGSFEIVLEKGMDFIKLLDQKRIISLESVELDKNNIKYESSITVGDTLPLLKTMMRKIKNMLSVMTKNYNIELINRWEEEIDKTKLLIDKSVISSLMSAANSKVKAIDLYYISLLAKDLERVVDHLIKIDKNDSITLKQILLIIDSLKDIAENLDNEKSQFYLNYRNAINLAKKVEAMKNIEVNDVKTYEKRRLKSLFLRVSEIMIDWAVTKEIENA